MNDFEKYLAENKKKLEPDYVDQKVWLAIENDLLKSKNKWNKIFIKSLVLGILLLAILFGSYYVMDMYKSQNNPINEEQILAEYDLTKYNFTHQIKNKKMQLVNATVPQDKLDDFQILLQQLEFMDGQFQDYRLYIEENGYQEFIGDQILNFYKSKIELLDKIQQEIEKINYYEKLQPTLSDKVGIQI